VEHVQAAEEYVLAGFEDDVRGPDVRPPPEGVPMTMGIPMPDVVPGEEAMQVEVNDGAVCVVRPTLLACN